MRHLSPTTMSETTSIILLLAVSLVMIQTKLEDVHSFIPTVTTRTPSMILSRKGNIRDETLHERKKLTCSRAHQETSTKNFFSAITEKARDQEERSQAQSQLEEERRYPSQQQRLLGSQELLMLPRQYGVNKNVLFPSMNHVSCTVINTMPKDKNLFLQAVQIVMDQHPLLHSYVDGDGEPQRRIDLLQMVRSQEPEPNPLSFVTAPSSTTTATPTCTSTSSRTILNAADHVVAFVGTTDVQKSWKDAFNRDLDDGSWCNIHCGPLWKLEVHFYNDESESIPNSDQSKNCALLLSFNHAISDQSSANRLIDEILRTLVKLEEEEEEQQRNNQNYDGTVISRIQDQQQSMPASLEDSVLGMNQRWSDVQGKGVTFSTIQYVLNKVMEGFKDPVLLPDDAVHGTNYNTNTNANTNINNNPLLGAISIISGREAGGKDTTTMKRKSTVQFRTINELTMSALLNLCHKEGVTVSNALTAAMTLTATDFVGNNGKSSKKSRNYKVLQSLDMRRFGSLVDKGTTFACMAGSHDLIHGPLPDGSGLAIRQHRPSENNNLLTEFWKLAREGKQQTNAFCNNSIGPIEAVRVFDFAMTVSDLNNLVYLTSQSKDTKGRAYSVGVTNVGVYERQKAFGGIENDSLLLQNEHGRYKIEGVYYGTPHTQSGCLYPMSCMTANGQLHLTFNPVEPIVSDETNSKFADAFVELIETVTGTRSQPKGNDDDRIQIFDDNSNENFLNKIPENPFTLVASAVGVAAVTSHGGAWIDFFKSVLEMKANVADPVDFWAALNFWIFFAAGHPLLPPILWISDVLHGSPGPKIADLIPVTFLAGNILFITAITLSKDIRNAVNIAAVAAFITYIGAGLDGTAGLGDYNLALDDSYRGQIVKGCPAYENVRQPSMDNFDLKKYQGLWYEHKFHDWTQFKEVYDTTLDIRLTDDGLGWVDDFAVKGPAPDAAKLSWDKSPVANGAHYFLFGRIDPNDPPGILREKGFGVEFPNYIVDVQKDQKTGDYTEAIQFQCLERGGVRVFEGINFMSRSPVMSDAELDAMHKRAEAAGMYAYGASPEQMHRVEIRPINAPAIDNNWQALWRSLGIDKLLELLTEAIEDGGR